jgi:hypothetical protein
LSKVFVAWLLEEPERSLEFASIAAQAAKRQGADQDFQTIAILGFAADAGLLSELQVEALKRGLTRLAGRSPVVNGVPMAFCADAPGILGVALGTRSIRDPILTGQAVAWIAKFLRTSYERGGADDWQRCLFAVADCQLGGTLGLRVPESAETADVRTALASKGLIERADGRKASADEVQTLALTIQKLSEDFDYDHAALRLAAVELVMRPPRPSAGLPTDATDSTEGQSQAWGGSLESVPEGNVTSRPQRQRGRPTEIPDERKQRALAAQGGKARAQILYATKYPTPQQVKNVSSILKHYRRKGTPNQV